MTDLPNSAADQAASALHTRRRDARRRPRARRARPARPASAAGPTAAMPRPMLRPMRPSWMRLCRTAGRRRPGGHVADLRARRRRRAGRALAAAVTDGQPPARPRRRRSLALRFGVSFVLGFLLAVGIGAGALYAWGQQYDGPGPARRPRRQHGRSAGSPASRRRRRSRAPMVRSATAQITLTGPDGETTTISYADVGRGPDTSALADAALAAGRQGDPLAEPHRRTPGRDPRRDPRLRRRVRPRQAGGRRRGPRHDDRPDPRGRHRVGRRRLGRSASPRRRTVAPSTRRPC